MNIAEAIAFFALASVPLFAIVLAIAATIFRDDDDDEPRHGGGGGMIE